LDRSPDSFPGEACRFECTLKHVDGRERRVLVISSGWLVLAKGKKRSAIVSVVDVSENTELKRINEEILRLNQELAANMKKLEEAQDALVKKGRMEQMGQLTATIAHELRNPLGAVRTSVFLMERKLKDKGLGVEQQLARINNGVVRCDNIITQLLDFSRTRNVKCEMGNLDQWLETVVEEESKKLPAALQISCDFGVGDRLVPFDGARLQRAIVNLLSNASEAMLGNGDAATAKTVENPEIYVSTILSAGEVTIRIADNGPGISADLLTKIREPLFTTKSFGTGLGLPAIEQIVAQHGGRLEITSEVGAGAVFSLHLPLVYSHEEAA
jgi:signal transduction histidine kinase